MRTLLLALLLAMPALACAQDNRPPDSNVPSAANDEITRRGNFVQRIDGIADGHDDLIAEALGPPADDSHKWFITVLTQRNCQPCAKLKQDFASAPELRAYVNAEDHTKSWAHFNVFDHNDSTQKWRWAEVTITGYPTLLIQPPRNGAYGDPKTVVFQRTGYSGDPKELANVMSVAFKRYIALLDPRLVRAKQAAADKAEAESKEQAHGQSTDGEATDYTPPFAPPPRVQVNTYPQPVPAPYDYPPQPQQPAPVQPLPGTPNLFSLLIQSLGGLLGNGTLTNLLLSLLAAFAGLRTFKKPPTTPPTTPAATAGDSTLSDLASRLKSILDSATT